MMHVGLRHLNLSIEQCRSALIKDAFVKLSRAPMPSIYCTL